MRPHCPSYDFKTWLATSASQGSDNDLFSSFLSGFLNCPAHSNATIDQIKAAIDADHLVVANILVPYICPATNNTNPHAENFNFTSAANLPTGFTPENCEGHYILLTGYDDNSFDVYDPAIRTPYKIKFLDFESRWRAYYTTHVRWMMEIVGVRAEIRGQLETLLSPPSSDAMAGAAV